MEKSPKNYKYEPEKKKHSLTFFLFILFLGVLIFMIYSSIYPNKLSRTITGNAVQNFDIKDGIKISAELTPPEKLTINSEISKIEIKTTKTILNIGNQKIELPEKSSVIINNFNGEIIFNSYSILKLNGKANEVFINGLPIKAQSPATISFDKETDFTYLNLREFYLDSISYITSGKIRLDDAKIILNPFEEKIEIDQFKGDIEVRKNTIKLNGYTKKSNIPKIVGN